MSDITMCSGEGCSAKESCHRFTAPVSEHRQSYFMKVPGKDESCNYYWKSIKAILKFTLPEDQIEFDFATNGSKWWKVCWDINQWLRQQYKYMPDEEYSEDRYNAYVEAREKLFELMQENGVNLEDV